MGVRPLRGPFDTVTNEVTALLAAIIFAMEITTVSPILLVFTFAALAALPSPIPANANWFHERYRTLPLRRFIHIGSQRRLVSKAPRNSDTKAREKNGAEESHPV